MSKPDHIPSPQERHLLQLIKGTTPHNITNMLYHCERSQDYSTKALINYLESPTLTSTKKTST